MDTDIERPERALATRLATPIIVLLVGVFLSVWSYHDAQQRENRVQEERFNTMSDTLLVEVESILASQQYLLSGLRGLFDASDSVERDEFHRYLKSVDLAKKFPGIYALGWNYQVARSDISAFEQRVRTDTSLEAAGYPDFTVKPATDNAYAHAVTYAEPMAGNEGRLGFDLGSNPQRARALAEARDTGDFIATEPIALKGSPPTYKGFLLFLPVYAVPVNSSLPERRSKYIGSLSGVFKVPELMKESSQSLFSALRIYDVTGNAMAGVASVSLGEEFMKTAFYSEGQADDANDRIMQRQLTIGTRQWLFVLSMNDAAMAALGSSTKTWIAPALGLLASVLSSLWVFSLISTRDLARRQAVELTSDLLAVNKNLERSNNDLSQFAYVASHDLQTPVRNVEMSVTLLEDALDGRIDSQVRQYLDYLHTSSERMQKLVQDLLAYARVDKAALQLKPIDLNHSCRDVLVRMSPLITEYDVVIHQGDLPEIMGDKDQVDRLFMNLLSNAICYRSKERVLQVDISATLSGGDWLIRIADNGMGIEKRFHGTVFEPFKRLHSHDDIAGSGLGLGICRQIVDVHGGSLYIKSSGANGTTFEFSLPAIEAVRSAA